MRRPAPSSVILMWWMWKSFSFLEMDLPILVGSTTVTLQHLRCGDGAICMLPPPTHPPQFHCIQSDRRGFCQALRDWYIVNRCLV